MVPLANSERQTLRDEFARQAEALTANVIQPGSAQEAIDFILQVIGDDKAVLAWDFAHIPLPGLPAALQDAGIVVANSRNGGVRVGITGVEAALAATGSIVISQQQGRDRTVSLLPLVHIAVLKVEQIMPHFDAWLAQQAADSAAFRAIGNHVVITGASRTADIGMELVLGAHGPADLHLVVIQ